MNQLSAPSLGPHLVTRRNTTPFVLLPSEAAQADLVRAVALARDIDQLHAECLERLYDEIGLSRRVSPFGRVTAVDVTLLDAEAVTTTAESTLIPQRTALRDSSLARISPYLSRQDNEQQSRIWLVTIPALLYIVVDLTRLRPKYDERSLRLALLEAGGLLQKLDIERTVLGVL